jgi:hypothetical protein
MSVRPSPTRRTDDRERGPIDRCCPVPHGGLPLATILPPRRVDWSSHYWRDFSGSTSGLRRVFRDFLPTANLPQHLERSFAIVARE